jgi:hypothetical protein
MKSVMTHPTPQRVLDAITIVAAWLREIDAVEALIAPTGGAAFHGERQADQLLDGWLEAENELALARAVVETARGWGMFVAQMDSGKLIREIEAYDAARGGREG